MSLTSEYYKAKQKRNSTGVGISDPLTKAYVSAASKRKKDKEDVFTAPVVNVKPTVLDDDIAPVKRTWFQAGAFEDGYQFGDVSKAILGTTTDLLRNATEGVVGMGEKFVDTAYQLGAWSYGGFSQNPDTIGNGYPVPVYSFSMEDREKTKQEAKEFIDKDLYDAEAVAKKIILSPYEIDAEKESLLGEKSDALAQSAGELAAAMAANTLAPGLGMVVMGTSAFGGELENAYRQGATFEEAGKSAAITAGAEILSEQLFGGIKFGGKALDDGLTALLSRNISNKTWRYLTKLGIDAGGEGTEEVVSQIFSNLGSSLYREENLKDILFSEEALDEYLESFIGGTALGGGVSSVNAVKSNANGVDYVSGLTDSEQAVVDAIYKKRTEEADYQKRVMEDKPTQKKSKIYDDIIRDLEKGYLSIEEVEEAYGGNSYKAYNDLLAEMEEYKSLYDTESGKLSERQKDRLAELKAKNAETPYNEALSTAWDKFTEDYTGFAKDSRLLETYNEKVRSRQAFEADLSKYGEKGRAVIQSAIDSGVLNNTNRSHEFVDFVAQIAADKDVAFDFTNNEKLRETGFALEDVRINGFVSDGKVTVNIDAAKSLNSVVGHEITHVLEGSELYTELQKSLKEYAGKEYDYRYKNLAKLYEGKNADIDAEVTADLIGDILFTDSDFVHRLSTNNRNVFEKIYDEIKYLCKVVTAGSKEARELEKVKKVFAEAYRANSKAQSETKYSLSDSGNELYNQLIAKRKELQDSSVMQDDIEDSEEYEALIQEVISSGASPEALAKYNEWNERVGYSALVDKNKQLAKEARELAAQYDKFINDKDAEAEAKAIAKIGLSEADYFRKQAVKEFGYTPYFYDAGYITPNGKLLNFSGEKGQHYGSRGQDHRAIGTIYANTSGTDALNRFMKDGNIRIMAESPGVDISTLAEPSKEQYATIRKFINEYSNKGYFSVDLSDGDGRVIGSLQYENRINSTRIINDIKHFYETGEIREQSNLDKFRFSLSDSSGKQLTEGQQEYFKDSKMRDDNGNLKVMYRGGNEDFTVFDRKKSKYSNLYGRGFYFTDSESHAKQYGNAKAFYLDIKNPVSTTEQTITKEQMRKFLEAVAENEDYGLENYGYGATVDSVLSNVYDSRSDFAMLYDVSQSAIGDMVAAVELFNEVNGTEYDGLILDTETVTFRSNQAKLTDNQNPTKDADIRFSLSEPVEKTDRFVAVHNKSTRGVMRMLERDGVPFASIAIKRAGTSHEGFGECSIVFPRSTIDPEESKWNKLYSNDAWTPTEPRPEYDVGDTYNYQKLFENMLGSDIYHALRGSSYLDSDAIERELGNSGGDVFEALKRLGVVKYGYLQSIGQRPEVGTKEKNLDGFHRYKNDQLIAVFEAVDGEAIRNASYDDKATLQQIADVLNEQFMKQLPSEDSVFKAFRKKPVYNADNINIYSIKDAYEAWEAAGRTIPTEMDARSLENALRDNRVLEEDADYQRWVEGVFDGLIKDSGIRNGKDVFTPSGNRRSFKQLHVPATLDNIVQQMRKENETGVGSLGGINLRGAATKTYNTVEDMRQDIDKLLGTHIDDEVYDGYMQGFYERLSDLIDIAAKKEDWNYRDTAEAILLEAVRDAKTKSAMDAKLRKEAQWINYNAYLTDDLWQLKQDVQNMPAPYFEAKPRRTVTPDEAAAYIIPDNAPAQLIAALNEKGLNYKTYKAGDEADRLAKVNSVLDEQPDLRFSLSEKNAGYAPVGDFNIRGEDVQLETIPEIAPIVEMTAEEMFPDTPVVLSDLEEQREALQAQMQEAYAAEDYETFERLNNEWVELNSRIEAIEQDDADRLASLDDADMPPEMDAPYYTPNKVTVDDPFEDRDYKDVGNRNVNAYMYENPEVKPFFQLEAQVMLDELNNTTRGERFYSDAEYLNEFGYVSQGRWTGTKRGTSDDIAYLLDHGKAHGRGYTYDEIRAGLKAIIEDNGAENNACSKRIEFILNDRLMKGYKNFGYTGITEPNQDYINLLNEKQITSYSQEAFDKFMETADDYAPPIAPVAKPAAKTTTEEAPVYTAPMRDGVLAGQQTMFEPKQSPRVANVLDKAPKQKQQGRRAGMIAVSNLVDKGMVFENLSLKTGNNEVQAKWDYALPSKAEARAQHFMEKGANGIKPLKAILKEVGDNEQMFGEYLYHVHNIDRMTLEERLGIENKAVYGDTVTADVSRSEVRRYEATHPEFKEWAKDIYAYNKHLRQMLVDGNLISQETAELWEKMYPHYVPIRRVDDNGVNISVPLDSRKTGVNNPIKRATGGSRDIVPLFNTMAERTIQTYKAIARNSFGIELKNTLGTTIATDKGQGVDEAIDNIEAEENLLKPGKNGVSPTFTVFENGERVEFEITEDMFDALKPANPFWNKTYKALNAVSNVRRNMLTAWNPVFALYRNPVKDLQDVVINSQHPARTYANMPKAVLELLGNGKYATEYFEHGGRQNTYYDSEKSEFGKKNVLKTVTGIGALEKAGEFIETLPRLAEFIVSRKEGRSIERSMLDAARVTTNFAAGGDVTKFFNRHGVTFLNASVQGASQHVRNIREAKQEGFKGWLKLATKYAIAGAPAMLLNELLWDDDEEYEELSDYVKDNYYIVAKTEDGKFIRIPKGRTAAVIQDCIEQIGHTLSGDEEADWGNFFKLFMDNIAPNNPVDNNILAPIFQTWSNKAWYGDDIVPSRLQDVPAEEQFDESTDAISKWLGEKTGLSPYKLNYLIDQYSGGLGDMVLPMLTPEAESGDDSFKGNMIAPWKKELVTDSVLNNQNVSDFYDLRDEMEIAANASKATTEDEMRRMYLDSVSWDMSDLYQQKREIQNSDYTDAEKYEMTRELQRQIDELAKEGLENYNNVSVEGIYAEAGTRRYNYDEESGNWYEIKPTKADGSDNYFYQQEQRVTKKLGISYSEYWNNREEYDFAYNKPEKYTFAKAVGGYDAYMGYRDYLENWQSDNYISGDKDANGNTIRNSRKNKVIDYINSLDADYYEKIILYKSQYNADDTYNYEIINYLNSREDISYYEMETILKELGFEVDSQGNITW